jgi:AMMECR1 domain-containing protein
MSDSVLLKLTRDSILEVYQARHIIKKDELLKSYPILEQNLNVKIEIFLDEELRSSYNSNNSYSLLENIIIGAKKAAFEDETSSPLTSSEYLHVKIKLTIYTDDGEISEESAPILKDEQKV